MRLGRDEIHLKQEEIFPDTKEEYDDNGYTTFLFAQLPNNDVRQLKGQCTVIRNLPIRIKPLCGIRSFWMLPTPQGVICMCLISTGILSYIQSFCSESHKFKMLPDGFWAKKVDLYWFAVKTRCLAKTLMWNVFWHTKASPVGKKRVNPWGLRFIGLYSGRLRRYQKILLGNEFCRLYGCWLREKSIFYWGLFYFLLPANKRFISRVLQRKFWRKWINFFIWNTVINQPTRVCRQELFNFHYTAYMQVNMRILDLSPWGT